MNKVNKTFLLVSILLLAANLRSPFTSLSPLVDQIMQTLGTSATLIGVVTSLPLLMFAIFSPLCPKLILKLGMTNTIVTALISIVVGIFIRALGSDITLVVGTILIGIGIAVGNVALPTLTRENFPAHVGAVTAFYTLMMGLSSTVISSVMVPISQIQINHIYGWQTALFSNIFIAALGLGCWLFLKRKSTKHVRGEQVNYPISHLIKQPTAWFITLALGLNSFTFYSFAGWLPKLLIDFSYSEVHAGYIYGLLQAGTTLPGLVLIVVFSIFNRPKILIAIASCLAFFGIVGLIINPQNAMLWVFMFGFGNCANFIVLLSLVSTHSASISQTAMLSSMSQSIGYALASFGPILVGKIHQATNNWYISFSCIAFVAAVCVIFSILSSFSKKMTDSYTANS